MRRFFSILLLMVFALPLLTPLLTLTTGAVQNTGLPACCRRDGAHRCAMPIVAQAKMAAQDRWWNSPAQTCPFRSVALLPATGNLFRPEMPVAALFSAVLAHPSGIAQAQSRLRIAQSRSRQKRGPPASSFVESIS